MCSNTSYLQGPFEQTEGALLDLEMCDLGGIFDVSLTIMGGKKNKSTIFINLKNNNFILHAIFPVQMLS